MVLVVFATSERRTRGDEPLSDDKPEHEDLIEEPTAEVSRREFVGGVGLAAAALAAGLASCDDDEPRTDGGADGDVDADGDGDTDADGDADGDADEEADGDGDVPPVDPRPYILLITTDQEHPPMWFRHDQDWIDELLPARAFLRRFGVSFTQAHCVAMPCSPSRASLYSSLYAHQHHVYGNCGMDGNHLHAFPTCATVLRDEGYRTWYCGKSHLASMDSYPCDAAAGEDRSRSMSLYGFDNWITSSLPPYHGAGAWPEDTCYDSVGAPYEGESEDPEFATAAVEHLGRDDIRRRPADAAGPWFGVVSFVNPHDILVYPAFEPREYETPIEQRVGNWEHADDVEAWKPTCQREYITMYNFLGGPMPHGPRTYLPEEWTGTKWDTFADAYLYLQEAVDEQIRRVLEACFALDRSVRDNLVVIFTSDHGELLGAHGQRAKGPTMYEEQQNVPLIVVDFSAPALRALDALPLGTQPSSTDGGAFVGRLGSVRTQLTSLLDVSATVISLGHSHEADPEAWRASNLQMQGASLVPLLADGQENAPVMAPDPATEGALAPRDHILATCDQTFGSPLPEEPLGWEPVSTAFHIISIREQARNAAGDVTGDTKLNLNYDWPRDPATGLVVEDESGQRADVDWEHPHECELYDLTESEPSLREVSMLVPREMPRAVERDGRLQVQDPATLEWSDVTWPPKWELGPGGRRRVEREYTAEEKDANIAVYRRLFDRLVHQCVPREIIRPMPAGLAEVQQAAWDAYHDNNNSGECDPNEDGICPGM
jgi:arylsulfatase A-like enzyme